MFHEIINIKNVNHIRYGGTKKSLNQTKADIEKLLKKHGVEKIGTMSDGNNHQIAFEYQGKPYVFNVPQVFVKGVYNERVGIRQVYRFLEIVLEWDKQRVIDFDFLMLAGRMLQIDGKTITLLEAVNKMPQGRIPALVESLPEPGDGT